MRGQVRFVLDRIFPELIAPSLEAQDRPDHLLGEIFASLAPALLEPTASFEKLEGKVLKTHQTIAEQIQSAQASEEAAEALLLGLNSNSVSSEKDALRLLASIKDSLAEAELEKSEAEFMRLLTGFVETFSLSYYVGRDGRLFPSFPGVASRIFDELRSAAFANSHTSERLSEFEHAVSDCIADPSHSRVHTAIQKQVSLVESLGYTHSADVGETFGAMCANATTWPHEKVQEAARAIAKFANNQPGVRHGGTPTNALRATELRDFVAVTLAILGMTPYLTDQLPGEAGVLSEGERWSRLAETSPVATWEAGAL